MRHDARMSGGVTCLVVASAMAAILLSIAVRLRDIQVLSASEHGYELDRQSIRRIQTDGVRGRILDRFGGVLADNRVSSSISVDPAFHQAKTWDGTVAAILKGLDAASRIVGRPAEVDEDAVRRHVRRNLARPLVAWRRVSDDEAARFFEHEREMPGFVFQRHLEREYPRGALAAHVVGYVGRDRVESAANSDKFDFAELEMRGRSGLEYYYDSFLRGVPGEKSVLVDARGFARNEKVVVEPKKGPDLKTSIDPGLQAAAEEELSGCRGACVVLDPDTGEVLAMASAPSYDLNDFVPVLPRSMYKELCEDESMPLLNRAAAGTYAPGSTFKPVTALAALSSGMSDGFVFECEGVFSIGGVRIRCTRQWGHGDMDMYDAMKSSCNPYFCKIGTDAGLDALREAAFSLGLGERTGIDFPVDAPGVVPDAAWKEARYSRPWHAGDLAQMSIGQGMLLATPLQMARVAAAIGTGTVVSPVMRQGARGASRPVVFGAEHLESVRKAMRLAVESGTGSRAGEDVNAFVIGKTGTAEVGEGAARRKNAWFIAFATSLDGSRKLAVSMVVENGESGGTTAAPKVGAILRKAFGGKEDLRDA